MFLPKDMAPVLQEDSPSNGQSVDDNSMARHSTVSVPHSQSCCATSSGRPKLGTLLAMSEPCVRIPFSRSGRFQRQALAYLQCNNGL